MLNNQAEESVRNELVLKTIQNHVVRGGYTDIKSRAEGYEAPSELRSVSEGKVYIPDITAMKHGRKSYFDIAIKPENAESIRKIVSKWKLLQSLSALREGKFFVIAPRGHYAFAERLCDTHHIQANIIKI